jgi:hypothetical protein
VSGAYIGVTGFMTRADVDSVRASLPDDCNRLLMVGVLVSSKTLAGNGNRYQHRYPKVGTIASLFPNDRRCLNLIHYATDKPENLASDLDRLTAFGGENLDGFQLNIAWPNLHVIAEHRRRCPSHRIVIQLGQRVLADLDERTPGAVRTCMQVAHAYGVTDVLVDASGGAGRAIDLLAAHEHLDRVRGCGPGIGIAGGLSAETIDSIAPIAADVPNLSIDAEGRLRDADDHLDVAAAIAYVTRASSLLRGVL